MDWSAVPCPLSNWPADAIEVTLHYFYSGCLPSDVLEETIETIHTLLKNNKKMKELHEICAQYLESTALKRSKKNMNMCHEWLWGKGFEYLAVPDCYNSGTFFTTFMACRVSV
jgi:hypothetical protein